MRSDDEPRNGRPVRKKLGVKIKGTGQSDTQPVAPVSPSVQFNPNIGLGQPQFQGTGGGNPRAGRLPPPTEKPDLLYPDPIESKGGDDVGLDFVKELEKQKQLDPLTGEKYTLDQKRIQAQGLNKNNLITMGFYCNPISTGSQDYIATTFNTATGDSLVDYITFGDYYNIMGIECSLLDWSSVYSVDVHGEVEFYLMQLGAQDTAQADPQLYAKIPTPIQQTTDNTNTTFVNTGAIYGNQRIRASLSGHTFFNYAQQPINAPRTYGLALSGVWANLDTTTNTANAVLTVIVYLDKSTAGQNL